MLVSSPIAGSISSPTGGTGTGRGGALAMPWPQSPAPAASHLLAELSTLLERVRRIADDGRYLRDEPASSDTIAAMSQAADLLTTALGRLGHPDRCRDRAAPAKGGLTGWQVRAIKSYVSVHLGDRIQLAELAHVAQISTSYLCRAFHVSFGCSPGHYLRNERLLLAKTQLRSTEMVLSEIAYSCGFADQPHFTRIFRSEVGMTPRAWRMACRHFDAGSGKIATAI